MTDPGNAPDDPALRPGISRRRALGGLLTAAALSAPPAGQAQARTGRVIRAQDFGLRADGVTDDAAALSKAFAAMSDDGLLVLPGGTIAVGSAGWKGLSLQRLRGIRIQGNGTTLRWLAQPAQSTGPFGPTALLLLDCRNAVIEDLVLNGNGIDCIGLGLESCSGCTLRQLDAIGHGAAHGSGLGQFASCKGSGNSWLACRSRESTAGSQYRGFYLGNGNSGWGERDLRIDACSALHNDATGFAIGAERLICSGCTAMGNAGAGFISGSAKGSGSSDHLFIGNIAQNNAFHGWQSDVYGPKVERIVLEGNHFSGNTHTGILCNEVADILICGNVLRDNGASTGAAAIEISNSSDVIVSDNLIEGDAAHGTCISTGLFANTVKGLVVANNRCKGSRLDTLWLEARDDKSSLESLVISGNLLRGGKRALYLSAATPRARISGVLICNNLIAEASAGGYVVAAHEPGQISGLRLLGNAGGPASISEHAAPAADANNGWNGTTSRAEAAPTSGHWQRGDLVYNTAPAPGLPVGWVCTAAGSPGTWHAFGMISG